MCLFLGTDSWPSGVRLVHSCGHQFEGIYEGPIDSLRPKEKRTITVALKAPPVPGGYRAEWRLVDLEGRYFGGIELMKYLSTDLFIRRSIEFRVKGD